MPEGRTILEAYKIGITVALTNKVSSILGMISRDFAKTDADAVKLQRTLKEIRLLGAVGAVTGGLGFLGLEAVKKTLEPAREYAHQLNIMNMAGMQHKDIAEAIGLAWKNTSTVITTTATENLRSILDLKNVLGDLNEARMALPIVSKIGAVMASASEGKIDAKEASNVAFSMAKALDIIGAARDPAQFEKEAGMMSKVITAFQNRVTPQMFQGVFQFARQSKFDLSDEFKYEFLPSLMLESAGSGKSGGGGSRGVGPAQAALYRVTNQGYINKKSVPLLEDLGLITKGDQIETSTPDTVGGKWKNAKLAANNPFEFLWQEIIPAIHKKFGDNVSDEQTRSLINEMFRGNQLAAQMMVEFFTKPQNFRRDQQIIRGAKGYNEAYDEALKNDPELAFRAAEAQWTNLKTVVGNELIPILIPALHDLANGLHDLSMWGQAHPRLTHDLVLGFTALSGALAFSGTVLALTAAFKGLKTILTAGGLLQTLVKATTGGAPAALPPENFKSVFKPGLATTLGIFGGTGLALGTAAAVGAAANYANVQAELAKPNPSGTALGQGLTGEVPVDGAALSALADRIVSSVEALIGSLWVNMDGTKVGKVAIGNAVRRYQSAPGDSGAPSGEMTPILNGGY